MRPASDYRAARRNARRAEGTLNIWHTEGHWKQANLDAKLPDRARRCESARRIAQETVMFFAHKIGFSATLPLGKAVAQAMLAFYLSQMGRNPGRAHMRIIREQRKLAA